MKLVPATPEKIAERMALRSGEVTTGERAATIRAAARRHEQAASARRAYLTDRAATSFLATHKVKGNAAKRSGINLRLERIISKSGGGRATWAFDARAAKASR